MTEEHSTSIRICQEGHANAIALNREYTQIAVAGRSLLKVYSIDADGFSEVCNMRGGKNQNLSYSSNDVAWSVLDSNLLATAATNGVVSVWDLSKFGRQKQLYVYSEHERTAHTVTFHGTEPLLISGSQDGTIKCFDLRVEKAIHTYCSNSESVRDVKFSPQYPNTFAAVSESGTIQLWDLKRPDKCQLQFTAHSGPIYTCDWHPTQPWLATGSRDKQIKIWNMEQKPILEYTIHTIAVVGRIRWRPDKMYHIASCALVVDSSIYVWDIRRPYIPYVAFNKHTNVTTGIAWKGNDPHILLSSSKDSTVHKHSFRDAIRPNDRANPQSTSISHSGDMLFSYKIKNLQPVTVPTTRTSFMTPKPKQHIMRDQFHLAKSCLVSYNNSKITSSKDPLATTNLHKDFAAFKGLAKEYLLWGKTLSELCEHNAEIAKKHGKSNVAMLWKFVKNQYSLPKLNQNTFELRNANINQSLLPNRKHMLQNSNAITTGWGEEQKELTSEEAIAKMCCEDIKHQDFRHPKSGEFKHTTSNPISNLMQNVLTAGDTESVNNFMYGESELTVNCVKGLRNGFLYIGPHDLTKLWSLPSSNIVGHELQTAKDEELTREQEKVVSPTDPVNILRVMHQPKQLQWEPHEVLAEGLNLQAEMGDVQTSVCILTVLGERRNDIPIDKIVQEYWLLSYIELLHHHQLWNEATEIINFSWLRSVYELNQQSTTMHTNCGDCGKPFASSGWYCQKCKSSRSSKCSVCNRIVTGLYAWCQGCSHGGHLMHMKDWFSKNTKCPRCGHLCEYE